jgi:hypothetical protein
LELLLLQEVVSDEEEPAQLGLVVLGVVPEAEQVELGQLTKVLRAVVVTTVLVAVAQVKSERLKLAETAETAEMVLPL